MWIPFKSPLPLNWGLASPGPLNKAPMYRVTSNKEHGGTDIPCLSWPGMPELYPS